MTPAICFSRLDFDSAFCKIILTPHSAAILQVYNGIGREFCINLGRSVKRPLLILSAFGIGVLFTALTAALSYFASRAGAELVSEMLFWPNTLMQA